MVHRGRFMQFYDAAHRAWLTPSAKGRAVPAMPASRSMRAPSICGDLRRRQVCSPMLGRAHIKRDGRMDLQPLGPPATCKRIALVPSNTWASQPASQPRRTAPPDGMPASPRDGKRARNEIARATFSRPRRQEAIPVRAVEDFRPSLLIHPPPVLPSPSKGWGGTSADF